jgi:hypothetical protein
MRQIFVDSRDRVSGTSSQFSITLPQTLALESGHQGRIDDLRIPNSVPTISALNNTIQVLMGAQYYDVSLSVGQTNSGPELANIVRQALVSIPGNWSVDYYVNQMVLSITCSNPYTFTGGSFIKQLLARPYTQTEHTYNFLYVPLQGVDVCYLCCSNFTHLDSVGPKGASDCLCSIPINVPFGSVTIYSMSSSVFFDIPAITTQQLSFELRDRDYNLLNSNANISFTLTID